MINDKVAGSKKLGSTNTRDPNWGNVVHLSIAYAIVFLGECPYRLWSFQAGMMDHLVSRIGCGPAQSYIVPIFQK